MKDTQICVCVCVVVAICEFVLLSNISGGCIKSGIFLFLFSSYILLNNYFFD